MFTIIQLAASNESVVKGQPSSTVGGVLSIKQLAASNESVVKGQPSSTSGTAFIQLQELSSKLSVVKSQPSSQEGATNAFTITLSVSEQPLSVTVSMYIPASVTVGFRSEDIYPFGPVQAYIAPAVEPEPSKVTAPPLTSPEQVKVIPKPASASTSTLVTAIELDNA